MKLADYKVQAMVAVKDLVTAKKFYVETLGLKLAEESVAGLAVESGGAIVFVYQSQFAGTNQATSVSWNVDDIDEIVKDLATKEIKFIHYDYTWARLEGDVHILGEGPNPPKAAWFKDPDGNILGLNSGTMAGE